jgi:ABC-type uncharacterized transport system substrate-binding protein
VLRAGITLIILFLITTLSIASEFRIAFVSRQSQVETELRAAALRKEIELIWPKSALAVNNRFKIATYSTSGAVSASEKFAEIVASNPALIYANGVEEAKLLGELTNRIPIVFGCVCNPGPTSRWKLIKNLCEPEGNITGFTQYEFRESIPKNESSCSHPDAGEPTAANNLFSIQLRFLSDSSLIRMRRIGLFYGDPYDETRWKYIEKAKTLGIALVVIKLSKQSIKDVRDLYSKHSLDGAIFVDDNFLYFNSEAIVAATSAIPKPAMFPAGEADLGAWMHYRAIGNAMKEAASYIVPILQGKPIRELPVGFPKEYELVVNHKLAKEHGWVFPKKFLLYPQREPKPQ